MSETSNPRMKGRHNPSVSDPVTPRLSKVCRLGHTVFMPPLASNPNEPPPPCAIEINGKIGQTVYQRTRPWVGQGIVSDALVTQVRRHVIPADPRTTSQLLNRARFGSAVRAWKYLTDAERLDYNSRGARKKQALEGLNLFVREYCSSHSLHEFEMHAERLRVTGKLPPEGPGP
jgi:hypothetical protein